MQNTSIVRLETETTVKETWTWDQEQLRKLLADTAGVDPESVVITIYEEEDREGGLGGGYYIPPKVTLTRTQKK